MVWTFHLFLYEQSFSVVPHQQDIVTDFSNAKAKMSQRIERWDLYLQNYRFCIVLKHGKGHKPADFSHIFSSSQLPTMEACVHK